jgi:hypothetical protein
MRRVLWFVGRFALVYTLFVALWVTVIEQRYNDGLAAVCSSVLAKFEQPRLTADISREGDDLVVRHVQHFSRLEPQRIVTRRVHSNTALFVALTLATPVVSWELRVLWLAGGGILLIASHAAHIIAYVHHHYALHNIGQYTAGGRADELADLGLTELWGRPAALRRYLALATASVFNIALQRIVPIALWLPLFLGALRTGGPGQAPPGSGVSPRARRFIWVTGLSATVAIVVAAALSLAHSGPDADNVEGIRPGMSALAAKRILEERGYDWVSRPSAASDATGSTTSFADLWPRRGYLTAKRYGPRYNWIGIAVVQPMDRRPGFYTACVAGVQTAASDERPERIRLVPRDGAAVCRDYWGKETPVR